MDLFRGTQAFVAVAETGSFRKAATQLGVTAAAVSKAVLVLERDTGARLFNRTSRHVELTSDGRAYYERCREALAQVQAGRDLLSASRKRPHGKLTVSSSYVVARYVLSMAADWLSDHPEVELELRGSDQLSRLNREDVDIGVRVGPVSDDDLVARELRRTQWVTVGSPSYLARRGEPKRPEDLTRHECVRFVMPRGDLHTWAFATGPVPLAAPAHRRLVVDNGAWLLDAALLGAGLCQVPDFMAAPLLREGRLVEVLGSLRATGPTIWAVFLPARRNVPKVKSFVAHLQARFAKA
jgi:LysR family transcriptional regulator, regulator for bpeEF and oprC